MGARLACLRKASQIFPEETYPDEKVGREASGSLPGPRAAGAAEPDRSSTGRRPSTPKPTAASFAAARSANRIQAGNSKKNWGVNLGFGGKRQQSEQGSQARPSSEPPWYKFGSKGRAPSKERRNSDERPPRRGSKERQPSKPRASPLGSEHHHRRHSGSKDSHQEGASPTRKDHRPLSAPPMSTTPCSSAAAEEPRPRVTYASEPGREDPPPTPPAPPPPCVIREGTSTPEALAQELERLRSQGCTLADRHKLFRQLQLKWHPDKNVGNEEHAKAMFMKLEEAKATFLASD